MTKRINKDAKASVPFADDEAGRYWRKFFEYLETVKETTSLTLWGNLCLHTEYEDVLRDDALALDDIEKRYNKAKSTNKEKAYALLDEFSYMESEYRQHLSDICSIFTRTHGRSFGINIEKGSVQQIEHWHSLYEQAKKHLDYVELGVRDYSARERIDATAAVTWTRAILAQVKVAWRHAERQFNEREGIK